jgi:hypothetical protein
MKLKTKVSTGEREGVHSNQRATVKVKSGVKAGGTWVPNHNRGAVKVKSGVKAGGTHVPNHNRGVVKVRA